ncbi:MAG: ribosomal-processing cysteine protease Prp [Candidatus Baltobacteraceae bacterium]
MLTVTFYRDDGDRLSGLFARGHTEFDEHGQDIVCAAVSAILLGARLGLERHAGIEVAARQEAGELDIRWGERERDLESVRAIVATAELAVAQIASRFPDHVRLKHERVTT